ncbi:hypothetical protein K504DRAFT_466019 [Pleomassaria siparia CBS 279.74]|uniref:Uncharacterized protein n=1 Tax=Pleomassaria siparia CBS 279.74 TaxID=1314801 RepID=A0A6G1KEE1_9PLEO|nr:hypothetical protein K504DRAFT_466019 [Pleomassaria siparia CBS 279.74]
MHPSNRPTVIPTPPPMIQQRPFTPLHPQLSVSALRLGPPRADSETLTTILIPYSTTAPNP